MRVVDLLEQEILLKMTAADATSEALLTLPEDRSRGQGWRCPGPAGLRVPACRQREVTSVTTRVAALTAAVTATTTVAVAEATSLEVMAAWENSSLDAEDIRHVTSPTVDIILLLVFLFTRKPVQDLGPRDEININIIFNVK
jgi:hypothetical protein